MQLYKIVNNALGEEYAKIEFDIDLGYIHYTTKGYVGVEEVKVGVTEILNVLNEHPGKIKGLISDISQLTGPWMDANPWIAEVWMPQAIEGGIRFSSVVISTDVFSNLSFEDLKEQMVSPDYIMKTFDSVESAKEWLVSKI